MKITVGDLCQQWKLESGKQFYQGEIQSFLKQHEGLLGLEGRTLDLELANWSKEQFETLLEMLQYLGKSQCELKSSGLEYRVFESDFQTIAQDVFARNSTRELFHKFILPKSIQDKSVNYGYSDFQKTRFADLSMSFKESMERMHLVEQSFSVGKNCSPERLRRQRKTAFDIIFTCYAKRPSFESDMETEFGLLARFDEARAKEVWEQTDGERGSIHHVLFGLCSGSDDYLVPLWFNAKSKYNFLCLVLSALDLLKRC